MKATMKNRPTAPNEMAILDVFIKLILRPGSRMGGKDQEVISALRQCSRRYQDASASDLGESLHSLSVNDMKRTVNKVQVILHRMH